MLMALCVLVFVALVPLAGGNLRRLGEVKLSSVGLLFGALLLQILVTYVVSGGPRGLLVAGHLLSYVLAAVFLWRNRRIQGLPLLAVGALSNGVTIALNGGTLPASAQALRLAGIQEAPTRFTNSGVLHHPRLPWLGDIFAVPASWPLANVFSVGDIIIVLAAGQCLWLTCRPTRQVRPVDRIEGPRLVEADRA